MLLDAVASESHYLHHLLPVWAALDPAERGTIYTTRELARHLTAKGITAKAGHPLWSDPPNPTLTTAWKDARAAMRVKRPAILAEHGAGQTYVDTVSPSYIAAPGRDGLALVLTPNETLASAHLAAYPSIPAVAVGCPKLDRLLALDGPADGVALTHHWACKILPETIPAWSHFHTAYRDVASTFDAIGHAHPRAPKMADRLRRLGFRYVAEFAQVVRQARVLVVDNSSVGPEWLALDRPVVWLNAPWYRRDVHHGGRFWDWAPAGVEVDDPADLVEAIALSLTDDPKAVERRAIVPTIYANLGSAAPAAVAAIRSQMNPRPSQ